MTAPALPRFFGPYEILELLGSGMTSAYKAARHGRIEVLKIVKRGDDPRTRRLIETESRGAAILRHLHRAAPDHFVEIYDTGFLDGYFYVSMQHISGESLESILAREGRLTAAKSVEIAAGICRRLEVCHGSRTEPDGRTDTAVVHGDIKPSNVQIDPRGEVWLLDFGIAQPVAEPSGAGSRFGTVEYCSPEYLGSGELNPSCDLWAVAILLYEMIEGAPPFRGARREVEDAIRSRTRPVPIGAGRCPKDLWRVLEAALDPAPALRFQTAGEFLSVLLSAGIERKRSGEMGE